MMTTSFFLSPSTSPISETFDFKTEGLTFLKIHVHAVNPFDSPPRFRRMSGSTGALQPLHGGQNFISNVLRKITNFHHHIINPLMLGINTERRFLLGDADQAGIEANIIPYLRKASENDIISSGSRPRILWRLSQSRRIGFSS